MENLKKLVEVKKKIKELESEAKSILPIAEDEALDLFTANCGVDLQKSSHIVYRDNHGKVVLKFVNKVDYSHISFKRIEEDLASERLRLYNEQSDEIDAIDLKIAELKSEVERLQSIKDAKLKSKLTSRLIGEFENLKAKSTYQVHSISVYL